MKQKFFCCLLFFFLVTITSSASVLINEMMVKNVSSHLNEDFNYEGWVELYNSGAESVDLSSCFFSDNANDLEKWQNGLGTLTLAPGAFTVFYFDELDMNNHASFKLDADGGVLILSDSNGKELDRVAYQTSYRNASYGRITDGGSEFGYFITPTMEASNSGSKLATKQTTAPQFSVKGGFYSSNQTVSILSGNASAKVYYTSDGREPSATTGTLYTSPIQLTKSTPLRAVAIADGEIKSTVTTATYFIGIDTIPTTIPVVSLVTDPDLLYGDQNGIITVGTNGLTVPTQCSSQDRTANYMQEWDRPCNFEFFDENGLGQLNQEVKIGVFGACSRTKAIKSLTVKANKIYGNNKLKYPIFKEKPNIKIKSVVLRNSGNDFGRMLFRDGYLQTLSASNMDVDHQAYQPAVIFVNGEYYALFGIRERTNKDFLYSNYALDEEKFCIQGPPADDESDDCDNYQDVVNLSSSADLNSSDGFGKIDELIDVDEFLNYLTAEIYIYNRDWSSGNIKAWKRNASGKWRWILYDTDMSCSLYEENMNSDGFSNVSKNEVIASFLKNDEMKRRLATKFVYHTGTTFTPARSSHILDSMVNNIKEEAVYFNNYLNQIGKNEVSSWDNELEKVRNFIAAREEFVHQNVATNLELGTPLPLRICSNVKGATYLLNDLELIDVDDFISKYYTGSQLKLIPNAPDGYKFKEWKVCKQNNLINTGDSWKYYYQTTAVDANWKSASFDDAAWTSAVSPLGTGLSYYIKSTLSEGTDSGTNPGGGGFDWGGGSWGGGGTTSSITTAYFRKSFNISNLSSMGTLHFTMHVNDGAVVYVNGKEIYRFNMPEGIPTDTTNAIKDMSSYAVLSFDVDKSCLQEGANMVSVELHNTKSASTGGFGGFPGMGGGTTFVFDLTMSEENSQFKEMNTLTNSTYSAAYNEALVLKAMFEKDENWNPSELKLYLNEIAIANNQYVDEYGKSKDWIEIYNGGSSSVDLGGMFLSDKRGNLKKYEIPTGNSAKTIVPAKGYIIFWADEDTLSERAPMHTNFALSKTNAQTISLSRMYNGELQVIDSIRYQIHPEGSTYARFSYEGNGNWLVTSWATFAAKNQYSESTVGESIVSSDMIGVRIYPNPVSDYLWFDFPCTEKSSVVVSDYMGRKLIESQISSGEGISVKELQSGVYFVVLTTPNGGQSRMKVVKR